MSITRSNPFQPIAPPAVRIADEPTSPTSPTPPAPAEPRREPPARPSAGATARPFHRREPGLSVMLASVAVGLAAFLVPDAFQRAAGLAAVGLLLVGVALLVFLPSGPEAGTTARPLYRREPWLLALYVAFSVGLSAAVVPAALQRAVVVVSVALLALGIGMLVLRRPDAAGGAGSGRGDGGTE